MRAAPPENLESVKDFWETHVNNEYYTDEEQASEAYFSEIETQRYRWHYHLRDLFRSLEGSRGRLLEVGSGIGVDSIQLARCGFDVTAVDLTDNAIRVARQFAQHRGVAIDFRLGNAEQLDFPDESFDAVYSFGVLHHTPDIEKAVAEVRRVLKPDGTAYVMLYHRDSVVNLAHKLLRLPYESPKDRKDHCPIVHRFSRRGAKQLFRQFSKVSVRAEYPFTYGFGPLGSRTPLGLRRALGRAVGWHLMITAQR
jgi:ubiquinone/menaquinone biosynthesis C-methylase UbiE